MTVSHPPGGRLPLLSARPAVTSPASEHHRPLAGTKLYCLVTEAHRCKQLAQGCYAASPRVLWKYGIWILVLNFKPAFFRKNKICRILAHPVTIWRSTKFTHNIQKHTRCLLLCCFWATVCKTVRPMLSVRCPVSLSVTLVYCGQTVGRMKMKLGTQCRYRPRPRPHCVRW